MSGLRSLGCLMVAASLVACSGGEAPPSGPLPLTRLETNLTWLKDAHGRYVFFHGVNVSGTTKVPVSISDKPYTLDQAGDPAVGGAPSFLGRPFDVKTVDSEIRKLRDAGFNAFRLLVSWEGVSPEKAGTYDTAYLKSIRTVAEIANRYGVWVLMDMHQDMFSRHLVVRYNEAPSYGDPGSIENTILALLPPYTDTVRGDGAPRWAVEACLQEKDLSSPNWGTPRLVSGMDANAVLNLMGVYNLLLGGDGGALPEWVDYMLTHLPPPFPVTETSDVLPMTNWGVAAALSMDAQRCFACLFAGDVAFPGLEVGGKSVKDYMQDQYAEAWKQVAAQVKDLPNVMGYDIINEPIGNFIVLTAAAALVQTNSTDAVKQLMEDLLGPDLGPKIAKALLDLRILPPDTKPETLAAWGLDTIDTFAILGLNLGFDKTYMKPFYEKVGKAILEVDPKAVIFIEPSMNITSLLGGGSFGMWDQSMTRPELPQVVYAPHFYTDIYPFIGFNQKPREFGVEEVRHRDYVPDIETITAIVQHSLGNVPVVFGEFGTYFNFGGVDASVAEAYAVSSHILDNYYEAYERLFQSQMLWCYSPDNVKEYGDRWNKEDFSVQDFEGQWRSEAAWSRPYARALAGKPLETHFYSPLHYFDPDKGVVDPEREFFVRYASKETDAPTEIYVPDVHYPDGFYVWLSDGRAYWDPETRTLSHYPADDEPGVEHWVRILPPLDGNQNLGWSYFFQGDRVIVGAR